MADFLVGFVTCAELFLVSCRIALVTHNWFAPAASTGGMIIFTTVGAAIFTPLMLCILRFSSWLISIDSRGTITFVAVARLGDIFFMTTFWHQFQVLHQSVAATPIEVMTIIEKIAIINFTIIQLEADIVTDKDSTWSG